MASQKKLDYFFTKHKRQADTDNSERDANGTSSTVTVVNSPDHDHAESRLPTVSECDKNKKQKHAMKFKQDWKKVDFG